LAGDQINCNLEHPDTATTYFEFLVKLGSCERLTAEMPQSHVLQNLDACRLSGASISSEFPVEAYQQNIIAICDEISLSLLHRHHLTAFDVRPAVDSISRPSQRNIATCSIAAALSVGNSSQHDALGRPCLRLRRGK
jgi:hypothetical protein